MLARAYLRASTSEQDALRARAQIEAFAAERGLNIAATYVRTRAARNSLGPNSSASSRIAGRGTCS